MRISFRVRAILEITGERKCFSLSITRETSCLFQTKKNNNNLDHPLYNKNKFQIYLRIIKIQQKLI